MSQVDSEKTLKENIELNNQQEQRNQEVTIKNIISLQDYCSSLPFCLSPTLPSDQPLQFVVVQPGGGEEQAGQLGLNDERGDDQV